jgi:hypothetical protein
MADSQTSKCAAIVCTGSHACSGTWHSSGLVPGFMVSEQHRNAFLMVQRWDAVNDAPML